MKVYLVRTCKVTWLLLAKSAKSAIKMANAIGKRSDPDGFDATMTSVVMYAQLPKELKPGLLVNIPYVVVSFK